MGERFKTQLIWLVKKGKAVFKDEFPKILDFYKKSLYLTKRV